MGDVFPSVDVTLLKRCEVEDTCEVSGSAKQKTRIGRDVEYVNTTDFLKGEYLHMFT